MISYILRRLAATVPVLFTVAVMVFLMLRLTPGDPAAIIAGDNATTQQILDIRTKLGLEQPILQQFFIWLGVPLRGELGASRHGCNRHCEQHQPGQDLQLQHFVHGFLHCSGRNVTTRLRSNKAGSEG